MQRTYSLWIATALVFGLTACGGGGGGNSLGKDPVIIDGVAGEGVVKRYSGTSKIDEELGEGEGRIVFDVQHIDRLVNKEVEITVSDADGVSLTPVSIAGNEPLTVTFAEGEVEKTLSARLVYEPSPITRHESELKQLVAHRDRKIVYKVKIEAPVGILDLRFFNDGVDVGSKVLYDLFPAAPEDGGERGEAVLTEQANSELGLAVPAGRYDVHATYKETETISQDAWIEGLVVESGLAKLVHEYDFAVTLHGFIMNARNFGEDVNAQSTVYFYVPGANVLFAVAQDQGPCGKRLVVPPGTYDVRVVYQPGSEQNTWGDKVIHNVEIGVPAAEDEAAEDAEAGAEGEAAEGEAAEGVAAEGDAAEGVAAEGDAAEGDVATEETAEASGSKSQLIEMEIDLEKALATLQVRALYGGEDVSDKAVLRAIFTGADKQAASALLNVTGLGTHVIPAGDYDIEISYDESDHRGKLWFEAIHLEHGDSWTEDVELRQ
jgi:hypothetical protein